MDRGRTLTSFDKMERKITGRKMDLVFFRQRHEYGCCEYSRYDGQTKELYDDGFKMVKVLKDILYNFYMKSLSALRDMTLVGFLLFDTKFTMVLCDTPAGYVCRINHACPVDLPEAARDVGNELLPMLKAVYQARLPMERTNKLVKQKPAEVCIEIEERDDILPSFTSEEYISKRR
ncbi:hypothetical protein RMATCC62417_07886 [Rhizopus microsporus]|nr:hypothetical protein RMATCC62417_07886 [Rhizopus microsporus]